MGTICGCCGCGLRPRGVGVANCVSAAVVAAIVPVASDGCTVASGAIVFEAGVACAILGVLCCLCCLGCELALRPSLSCFVCVGSGLESESSPGVRVGWTWIWPWPGARNGWLCGFCTRIIAHNSTKKRGLLNGKWLRRDGVKRKGQGSGISRWEMGKVFVDVC